MSLTVKEFWKSINIWWSYGQELGVLFFLTHSVYRTYRRLSLNLGKHTRSKHKTDGRDAILRPYRQTRGNNHITNEHHSLTLEIVAFGSQPESLVRRLAGWHWTERVCDFHWMARDVRRSNHTWLFSCGLVWSLSLVLAEAWDHTHISLFFLECP